ncbi:hypothetical protein EUX98_g7188 [Antrodiella citrinella]|uniref:Gelsolin-like domain-containing protein n=1 Tax=Antrodiella citrinella TaxID=2447956 RepID=A0A4S4MM64_9APHY|nr:hypothetical protein EUX98_g7188 [Antrodiella citrinella]
MAERLTQPTKYNIEDSNIALLGSDLEKNVREHAGDKDPAWEEAGKATGVKIWRIEKFNVVDWPKERYGTFYDGDSYIVLHTYKKTPDAQELSYDLHFWIGEDSTQDEAATAAYKTVELDDHLKGTPVEYREVQNYESPRFLSYFPRFVCQRGGVATGFHHVSAAPEANVRRLYRITATGTSLMVREVRVEGASVVPGDVYVLDMGSKVWQFISNGSVGKERFKAAEFVTALTDARPGNCDLTIFDEGTSGAHIFLSEVGLENMPVALAPAGPTTEHPRVLFRLSDASGQITFTAVDPPTRASLSSSDVFLLDDTMHWHAPAIYVWIGQGASLTENRLALQYAQKYLYEHRQGDRKHLAVNLVKMREGHETVAFLKALE